LLDGVTITSLLASRNADDAVVSRSNVAAAGILLVFVEVDRLVEPTSIGEGYCHAAESLALRLDPIRVASIGSVAMLTDNAARAASFTADTKLRISRNDLRIENHGRPTLGALAGAGRRGNRSKRRRTQK
jgi:hypothetical protein